MYKREGERTRRARSCTGWPCRPPSTGPYGEHTASSRLSAPASLFRGFNLPAAAKLPSKRNQVTSKLWRVSVSAIRHFYICADARVTYGSVPRRLSRRTFASDRSLDCHRHHHHHRRHGSHHRRRRHRHA
ncbi:hypothetical protein PUN28_017047 [Cardiocondyla obscurior]|uniref:Uncharacterized protein n=1 Tax=Cardiocondyla obscurior TaxID=286306 RepID=A0AAW2EMR5_9HYME